MQLQYLTCEIEWVRERVAHSVSINYWMEVFHLKSLLFHVLNTWWSHGMKCSPYLFGHSHLVESYLCLLSYYVVESKKNMDFVEVQQLLYTRPITTTKYNSDTRSLYLHKPKRGHGLTAIYEVRHRFYPWLSSKAKQKWKVCNFDYG